MTDILIIGGGIAGLSAAATLAADADVVVLEAEAHLGAHSSSRSAAVYLPGYGPPGVSAMIARSRSYFDDLGLLAPRGFMLVARPGEDAAMAKEAAREGLDMLTLDEAIARLPILRRDAVAAAACRDDVFDLDADRLLQHEAARARSLGAEIVTRARVTDIARQDGAWTLTTDQGTWQAPTLVNAAGAWADGMAEMAGVAPKGIVPHRRSMARLPAPGGRDVRSWPFVEAFGERWYARPDAGAWIVSPAEEDAIAPMDAWADDMVLAEGLARYAEMVTEPVTRVLTNWAGLRSFVPDRNFVIGRDPDNPDFVWCAGQGGNGLHTAPAATRLLADLLNGRRPDLQAALVADQSPARFKR